MGPDPDTTHISPRRRLWFKLIASVGLVLGLMMTVFTIIVLHRLEARAVEDRLQSAHWFSDTVKRATRYSMLKNQRQTLHRIIEDVGRQPGVETVRLFNKKGRIMFSSRTAEIGKMVDLQAEACYGCHFRHRPLERLTQTQRSRIYTTRGADAHRVVSVINPIYNKPACYNAACHAHNQNQSVLGVLDIGISLAPVDREVSTTTSQVIAFAVLIFLALSAVVLGFIFLFINRPLSSLLNATRQITTGDYDHPISTRTSDEIGALAESFDHMREAIKDKTEALDESRRQFKTLFEQVPCYISVQDRDFRLVAFNKMFERDFRGQVGDYCYAAYKNRDSMCENCSVEKTFRDGQVHSAEEVVISQDGKRSYILNLAAPVTDREGNVIGVMEMATDVTAIHQLEDELRASEEKYRLFFNNDPNPIFVFDHETMEILDANDPAAATYRCPKEELVGRSFLDLTDPVDQTRVQTLVAEGEDFMPRVRHVRRTGEGFFVNIRASYGDYLGRRAVIAATADITEQLQTEQQLIQAAKMATLGEMSAGVAHELNQPLSVLGTGANFLLKQIGRRGEVATDKVQEVATEMAAQVDRAAKIIGHLREFGRKEDVKRAKVRINDPIGGVFRLLGQQLRVRNIEVELDLTSDAPCVWGDPNRLEQVFINLILNARDAIEEGRAEGALVGRGLIAVRSWWEDGRVSVTVADNGPGVPDSDKDRIFNPFFTTKDVGKGTGLGLSITYGIVRDYDGQIAVEDRPGGGTIFRLTFPAAKEEDDD